MTFIWYIACHSSFEITFSPCQCGWPVSVLWSMTLHQTLGTKSFTLTIDAEMMTMVGSLVMRMPGCMLIGSGTSGLVMCKNCPILPCSIFYYKSTELVSIEIEHRPDPAGISMGEVEIVSAYSIGNPQQAIRRNTRNIMLVHYPAMNKVVTYEIDDLGALLGNIINTINKKLSIRQLS